MTGSAGLPAVAARLADEVLFPAAGAVEAAGVVPRSHLDQLARAGLYGLFDPAAAVDPVLAYRVVELIASGCLATAFVWLQHHSAVRAVAASADPAVPAAWLEGLRRGTRRAGVALGGLRPGPPRLRARPVDGGHALTGDAPWVTGWGLVDQLLVAARDADDIARWFLIDAVSHSSLTIQPLSLLAVSASSTVHIGFSDYRVPAGRLVTSMPFADWPERDAVGLRGNGSLALGLAGRCCRLLAELAGSSVAHGSLSAELDAVRAELDGAGPDAMPAARAAASALAMRSATTLVAATGARAALADSTAGRLLREAAFLLVFGSRPAIRTELLRRLPG